MKQVFSGFSQLTVHNSLITTIEKGFLSQPFLPFVGNASLKFPTVFICAFFDPNEWWTKNGFISKGSNQRTNDLSVSLNTRPRLLTTKKPPPVCLCLPRTRFTIPNSPNLSNSSKKFLDNFYFRDLLDMVGLKMKTYESETGSKQSCSYEVIHFYRKLFFNPGLYRDSSPCQTPESEECRNLEELKLSESPSRSKIGPAFPMSENLLCAIEPN